MMSRHFALSSELTGTIAKRLSHAKNQLSVPGSFFNRRCRHTYEKVGTKILTKTNREYNTGIERDENELSRTSSILLLF